MVLYIILRSYHGRVLAANVGDWRRPGDDLLVRLLHCGLTAVMGALYGRERGRSGQVTDDALSCSGHR